jgi:uncharacterized protein (DUF1501 family)
MTMRLIHAPSRRDVLFASGTLFAWAHLPKLAFAEGRDPRFLTIILRGALDGLATVAPVGDPDWIKLRGDQALTLDGRTPALKLNDFFALNPAMPDLHRLFKANEAIVVHACATPYRERSHFDGQDLLESGLAKPAISESGWLNRALVGLSPLAPAGRVDPHGGKAFAVGPVTPLVVRGPAPVLSWSPQRVQPANADTARRLLDLYRHADQKLAAALEDDARLKAIEHSGDMTQRQSGPRPAQAHAYFAAPCGSSPGQLWAIEHAGNAYVFRNLANSLCLDVAGGSAANGTKLIVWACNGGSNQTWRDRTSPNQTWRNASPTAP